MDFSTRKLIIVTVISDLVTDYRVHKVCQTLHEQGWGVILVGCTKKTNIPLELRDYQTYRLSTIFKKSVFFYAEFNLRLFFWLLNKKANLYLGNDLDVMPAMMLTSFYHKKKLVYDSHEYFLGMAGLVHKPFRRAIWALLEKRVFSNLKHIYTVSDTIRELYEKDYKKKILVVRNLPSLHSLKQNLTQEEIGLLKSIEKLIPENKNILFSQGAGINHYRGYEELILSMNFIRGDRFHLVILGDGDAIPDLRKLIEQNQLNKKITLIPRIPFSLLGYITRKAHLGFSIDKPVLINQQFSLPNKLFEYLHSGVPVLASRLVEQEKIINKYNVGTFIENHEPAHIAEKIIEIFENRPLIETWKQNTALVIRDLNWEKESEIIIDIFKQVQEEMVNQ